MKILVIFGGPGPERGISLNSARSLVDHLGLHSRWSVDLMFISQQLEFYVIDKTWLYCNTPNDFEFKVSLAEKKQDEELVSYLKEYDVLYPVVHGLFGEDGRIQAFFEHNQLPFVGSSSQTCRRAYAKAHALHELKHLGLAPGPYCLLNPEQKDLVPLKDFMKQHETLAGYIMKPHVGGSSLGIERFSTIQEFDYYLKLHDEAYKDGIVVEQFYQGIEFCVTVIELRPGVCCALIPCSIHYAKGEIFDYRKKYLPTTQTMIACPAQCSEAVYEAIRQSAEKVFKHFDCRHIARFDGWIFNDGRIAFSDINLISGMEQNSLVFIQAAACGMSHQRLCEHLIHLATAQRFMPHIELLNEPKKPVYIVFGGESAERQVSLMSASNVWLKLRGSLYYEPTPFLLGKDNKLYPVPYSMMLYHTVEEIFEHIIQHRHIHSPIPDDLTDLDKLDKVPQSYTLNEFFRLSQHSFAYVFLALHGGKGEDGTWQQDLHDHSLPFNGSHAQGSAIGMDKLRTAEIINALQLSSLYALPKIILNESLYPDIGALNSLSKLFEDQPHQWIVKPRADGCSTGIIVLQSFDDLKLYYDFYLQDKVSIPAQIFYQQLEAVAFPDSRQELILEPYIKTDRVHFEQGVLRRQPYSGWLELTQGVVEHDGLYHAFEASLAVSQGAVLSMEEKFQGGTGSNLTPVPFFSEHERQFLKEQVCQAAQALSLKNYARFDLFFHQVRLEVIIIEVNTLPALTPATVLYHQALAERPSLEPRQFLELIITRSWNDFMRKKNERCFEDLKVFLAE